MFSHGFIGRGAVSALILFTASCAPAVTAPPAPAPAAGLPPVPMVDGPLDIQVVHPTPGAPRPNVDSTMVYGSVGSGRATLEINGRTVQVAPNGAFIGFVPVPADGTYQLTARAGGQTATATRSYRPPASPAAEPAATPSTLDFAAPRAGVIVGGADSLRTGSDVAIGRTAPAGGTFRWFLPRGARVDVTGERGNMLRVQLDTATAWFPSEDIRMDEDSPPTAPTAIGGVLIDPDEQWVDLRVAAEGAPFLVLPEQDCITLFIYGRTAPGSSPPATDPLLGQLSWSGETPARLTIPLQKQLWGYKTFYDEDGELVLRIRRPPVINAASPLQGIRIVVDPGHPPAGATGPTGLTEAEANLAISLRLAQMLRERGAEVVLTRTTPEPLVSATDASAELRARTRLAADENAHLYVSVHNNAFPEGVDPFRSNGTSTYYFHPFSARFAQVLNEEIVSETRIRDLGHRWGNLAVVRPTWFPAALTESLFMPIPEQEAALRNPDFIERLAEAHRIGIERFLRIVAGTT